MPHAAVAIWAICIASTAGIVIRPFRLPEAVWAVAGAIILVATGLFSPAAAWRAVGEGSDVYLFLTGMMLLSEAARAHGLFDWAASWAVDHANGSPGRLFTLVFAVGIVVTTFLSNDATAVVLTPAVYAVARRAKVDPLPLLFICAFVANAASFVLPISNPANIVLYGGHMPPLGQWLESFAAPSFIALGTTYVTLYFLHRHRLAGGCASDIAIPRLSGPGQIAIIGLALTALVLIAASALNWRLGWPTCLAGLVTALLVQGAAGRTPLPLFRQISWSILPLVAGLFILVEAMASTGMTAALARVLTSATMHDPKLAAALAGGAIALVSNLVNNLPAGLVAAQTLGSAHSPPIVTDAVLIGVDLGPNLSITGSLATLLWLAAIRREGVDIGFFQFIKVGAVVTLPAVTLAILSRIMI